MKTESSVTEQPSLADVAYAIARADQSRWLKKYSLDEIAALLYRHRDHAAIIHDGSNVLGAAIAITNRFDETLVHIAFIAVFSARAIEQFVDMLMRNFPRATRISYIRRFELRETKIKNLPRMLRLTLNTNTR